MPSHEAAGLTAGLRLEARSTDIASEDSIDERGDPERCSSGGLARLVPIAVMFSGFGAAALAATRWRSRGAGSGRAAGFAVEGVESLEGRRSSGRYIRWLEHPEKCLDVWGDHAGAAIQLWACNDFHGAGVRKESDFKWILPAEGIPGTIVWAGNTSYCLNAPSDNKIQIWYCDTAPVQHTRWKVTADGRIHLAYHFGKCLDVPNGEKSIADGIKLQLWDCLEGDTRKEGNVLFDVYPQSCEWSMWSAWSACSTSCGGGMRYQARRYQKQAVNGGQACAGPGTKSEMCHNEACPTDSPGGVLGPGAPGYLAGSAGAGGNHGAGSDLAASLPSPTTGAPALNAATPAPVAATPAPAVLESPPPTHAAPAPPNSSAAPTIGAAPGPPAPATRPALASSDSVTATATATATTTGAPTVCYKSGTMWEPVNMQGEGRHWEASKEGCQSLCKKVPGCAHFSFWPDGGCHLQNQDAHEKDDDGVWSGPPDCAAGT